MVDLGVALTWVAISAASVKGLSALARINAASSAEEELSSLGLESGSASPAGLHTLSPANLLGDCP